MLRVLSSCKHSWDDFLIHMLIKYSYVFILASSFKILSSYRSIYQQVKRRKIVYTQASVLYTSESVGPWDKDNDVTMYTMPTLPTLFKSTDLHVSLHQPTSLVLSSWPKHKHVTLTLSLGTTPGPHTPLDGVQMFSNTLHSVHCTSSRLIHVALHSLI